MRHRALSRIGKCSARVNLGEGDLLIALRAYLDSSGKLNNDHMTLAAVAAPDDMWSLFEDEWEKIMNSHTPKGQYVHMREIYRLIDAFDAQKGWNQTNAFDLANRCLSLMSYMDKKRFRMFYCTVDINAWHKLRAETYQIPDPIDLCNRFCSETVLGWYLFYYPELLNPEQDTVRYFFDRNEYFYQPFYERWNHELNMTKETGRKTTWSIIEEVAPAIMQKTPGIQAADIIAWGMNRETFAKEGDIAKHLGEIIRAVVPAFSVIWNEAKLRQHFKPLLYLR